MYRWLLILLVLIASVAGLAIGVLNADAVTVDLLVDSLTLPLGALVVLMFVCGLLVGLVLAWLLFIVPGRFRRRAATPNRQEEGQLPADRRDG